MTSKISKISVEKVGEARKARFNYDHDVASTYGFGEVQPVMIRPCVQGQETHVWQVNSMVRLSPMAVATFGRIDYRISNHFVPFEDILPSWKQILGNQPTVYDGTGQVPHKFPTITQDFLQVMLSIYPYATYSMNIRGGSNSANYDWQYNPELNPTDLYKLGSVFPNSNNSFGQGSLFTATQFLPYANVSQVTSDGDHVNYLLPDAADFNCFFHDTSVTDSDFLFLTKLTDKGKRLYKILTGLGYKPSFNSDMQLNLLPLLAFYKAYFDAYSVPQYQNWYETNAYKLIKELEMVGPSVTFDLLISPTDTRVQYLFDFFKDLSECWYSEAADYVSACTPADGSLPGTESQRIDQLSYSRAGGIADATSTFNNYTPDGRENESFNSYTAIPALDQVSDEILKKLYLSVDRESAVGYNIKNRLNAKGYKSYVDDCESYFLGKKSIPVQIFDVNSTSDTANSGLTTGAPLGAYTGKGLVYSESNEFSYTNSELGYIITLGVIVPISSNVNALDPTLLGIDRYTFYNADYDAVGLEQISRAEIGHLQGTTNNEIPTRDYTLFGFLPRYTGYKVAPSNILNGEFSMKSSRQSWLPYTLDKVIVQNDTHMTANSFDPSTGKFKTNDTFLTAREWQMPSAGQDWRYPTNAPWKGNFNRIFLQGDIPYNSGSTWDYSGAYPDPANDNFLVHNIIDCKAWAFMKPLEDSYDTKDEDKNYSAGEITSKI